MKIFIKDVFDLMALNAKEINYYGKYSVVSSSLIIFVLAMAFHASMPSPAEASLASFSFSVILYFLVFIIATLVLRLWLQIKNIYVDFTCLYNLSVLASVIDLLFLPLALFDNYLNQAILLVLNVILFGYSLVIIISAVSKSTQAGLGFVFFGALITLMLVFMVAAIANIVAVVTGVLLAPEPFADLAY
jgi:hypothetical protein